MSKKKEPEELDPSFIISQAKPKNREQYRQSPKEEIKEEKLVDEEKETISKTKPKTEEVEADYESLFIKESSIKTRGGKVVYIRKEFHDRITKITRVIGDNDITLFSYLDNILEHHFSMFQNDIKRLYRKKNTDIF